jgi:hypothetical protein
MTSLLRPDTETTKAVPTLAKGEGGGGNGGYTSVHRQAQPHGEDGIRFSLKKVCLMIAEGRLHPDVIRWARKKLADAGNPKGPKARAKVLLEALKKQSGWVPDPVDSEFMPAAHLMLGDGDRPPFFALGDCFAEGTLTLSKRADSGTVELVPIENLAVGMTIWGLDDWTTVEQIVPRSTMAVDIVRLRGRGGGNGEDLRLTERHHVYVLDCNEHPMLEADLDDANALALPVLPTCSCSRHARTEKRIRVAQLRAGMALPTPDALPGTNTPRRPGAMRFVESIDRRFAELPCWDIQTSDHRVYLPEADVTVSQCDDLTIALGSAILVPVMFLTAAESVGTKAAVVGHAYGPDRMIEHVLGAIYDQNDNRWYYIDPSLPDMEFGECRPFTRERVYLVPSAELLCDDRVCLKPGGRSAGAPPMPRRGDFVAVHGAFGQDNPSTTVESFEMPSWVDGPVSSNDGRDMNATLFDACDVTGICEATVTWKPASSAEKIINQAEFLMIWTDVEPCATENPLNWCFVNPPAETDWAAHSLYEPWTDGISEASGEDWLIPDSGR